MRIVCVLLVTGCAANFADSLGPDAAGNVDAKLGAAHGVEGEHVEYEMKVASLTVGRFQVAVGNRGVIDGRPAVIVRSRAALAGMGSLLGNLDWELTTTIDIDSGFAIAQDEEVTIDAPGVHEHEKSTQTWSISDAHHNPHSAAGALRGWFTAPGAHDELDIDVVDTTVPVTIADAARDMVGTTPAVRYDGLLRNKHSFSVWVSDDSARVPIRMRTGSKIGTIEAEMVDYSVPRDHDE